MKKKAPAISPSRACKHSVKSPAERQNPVLRTSALGLRQSLVRSGTQMPDTRKKPCPLFSLTALFCSNKKKTLSCRAVSDGCAAARRSKALVLPRPAARKPGAAAPQTPPPAAPPSGGRRAAGFRAQKKRTAALAGGRISYDIAFILRPACNRPARGDCRSCAHFPRQCLQGFPDRRRSDSRCP